MTCFRNELEQQRRIGRIKNRVKSFLQYIILLFVLIVFCATTTVYIHTTFLLRDHPSLFPSSHYLFFLDRKSLEEKTSMLPVVVNTSLNLQHDERKMINISNCQEDTNTLFYYHYLNTSTKQEVTPSSITVPSVPSSSSSSKDLKRERKKLNRAWNRTLERKRRLIQQQTTRIERDHQDSILFIDPNQILIESEYSGIHPTRTGYIHTLDYNALIQKKKKINDEEDEEDILFQPGNLSMDFVMAAIHAFARLQTHKLHKRYVARILCHAKKYLDTLPSLLRVSMSIPTTRRTNSSSSSSSSLLKDDDGYSSSQSIITVVGDIHGDFYGMLHIFDTNGFPNKTHTYIFNGDVLDKGYRSIETLLSLLMIQLSCPTCLYITRGNHEDASFLQSRVQSELQQLYGTSVDFFPLLLDVVKALPLAVLVNDDIFVVHGGIVNPNLTLDEISNYPRGTDIPFSDSLITDLLWSDPSDDHVGVQTDVKRWRTYGEDIIDSFMTRNNISLVIRSHQVMLSGIRVHHHGRTITLYSAPKPDTNMKGAYINIDTSSQVSCKWFNAAPYPSIVWSKYGFTTKK